MLNWEVGDQDLQFSWKDQATTHVSGPFRPIDFHPIQSIGSQQISSWESLLVLTPPRTRTLDCIGGTPRERQDRGAKQAGTTQERPCRSGLPELTKRWNKTLKQNKNGTLSSWNCTTDLLEWIACIEMGSCQARTAQERPCRSGLPELKWETVKLESHKNSLAGCVLPGLKWETVKLESHKSSLAGCVLLGLSCHPKDYENIHSDACSLSRISSFGFRDLGVFFGAGLVIFNGLRIGLYFVSTTDQDLWGDTYPVTMLDWLIRNSGWLCWCLKSLALLNNGLTNPEPLGKGLTFKRGLAWRDIFTDGFVGIGNERSVSLFWWSTILLVFWKKYSNRRVLFGVAWDLKDQLKKSFSKIIYLFDLHDD